MSREVPKIEWLNETESGDIVTSTNTITSMADTSGIEVGMTVTGTGIPDGTTVTLVAATSVTLSDNATATGTFSFEFFFIFEFENPPIRDDQEEFRPRKRTAKAINGNTQTSVDHFEARLDLEFQFLDETDRLALVSFNQTHAGFGRQFRYYPDKELTVFLVYELDNFNIRPRKTTPKPLYSLRTRFRRVVS